MLELICQQRYKANGVPVDLTRYRNHGTATNAPRGPSTDASHFPIDFPHSDSQVQIGLGTLNAWNPLIALRIEVDVKLRQIPSAGKLGLVHGDGSFAFYLDSTSTDLELVAQISGPPITDIQSAGTVIPLKRWATLGLYHDGFSSLQLLLDGRVIAETSVHSGVPPVQAAGVIIGNGPSGGAPLHSEINEVRIWRLDPNQMRREFLCRPYNGKTAACWEKLFHAAQEWYRKDPVGSKNIGDRIEANQHNIVRGFLTLPAAEKDEGRAIVRELTHLWCTGHISGAKMRGVVRRWVAFLSRFGLAANSGPSAAEIRSAMHQSGIDVAKLTLECDPDALTFLRMFEQECESLLGKAS